MAQVEEFESLLKEIVQAKRLSASKMSKLTEIALKSMEEDTQLVSILYRTHKSLSSSSKVSSLYVFDALSRAAKHRANKQNLTGNINSSKGNSATFLLRVEGILEGLFRDIINAGSPELKEKAKKVYDIWVKGNTFPPAILSQLSNIIHGKENQVNQATKTAATTDPRVVAQSKSISPPPATKISTPQPQPVQPTQPTPPPAAPLPNPQSALLALLAQAQAQATTGPKQSSEQVTSASADLQSQQQLGAPQLALLQQLAQLGHNTSFPVSVSNPVPPVANDIDHGRSTSSRAEPYGSRIKDAQYDSSDRRDYNNHQHNHVGDPRGGFRGGRGRGFRDSGSRSPLQRTRRSRSRSPPSRYGGRRDIRPYSPLGRPTMASSSSRESQNHGASQPIVDEFGREIRPELAEAEKPTDAKSLAQSKQAPTIDPLPPGNPSTPSSSPSPTVNPTNPSTASSSANVPLGLENFDISTFDFTSPSSWETLGNMWLVTNGALPSTEQLMQFVMEVTSAGMNPASFAQDWNQPTDWSNASNAQGQFSGNRGAYHGRGGFQRGARGGGQTSYGGYTEAQVMAGDSSTSDGVGSGICGAGKMQKVGDKWMFVKDSDATVLSS